MDRGIRCGAAAPVSPHRTSCACRTATSVGRASPVLAREASRSSPEGSSPDSLRCEAMARMRAGAISLRWSRPFSASRPLRQASRPAKSTSTRRTQTPCSTRATMRTTGLPVFWPLGSQERAAGPCASTPAMPRLDGRRTSPRSSSPRRRRSSWPTTGCRCSRIARGARPSEGPAPTRGGCLARTSARMAPRAALRDPSSRVAWGSRPSAACPLEGAPPRQRARRQRPLDARLT